MRLVLIYYVITIATRHTGSLDAIQLGIQPELDIRTALPSTPLSFTSNMSWFKRKERSLIPPVQEPPSSGPGGYTSSYRSNVSTYNASRDGNLYNPPSRTPIGRSSSSLNDGYEKPTRDLDRGSTNPYRREERDRDGDRNELFSGRGSRSELFTGNSSRSDSYSQNEPEVDADRRELFAGYNPEKAGQNRFTDGPPRRKSPPPGEEGDEDVEVIKQDIRATKQDGLNSTRNALRLAREAEETAINTLGRLGDQSGPSLFTSTWITPYTIVC